MEELIKERICKLIDIIGDLKKKEFEVNMSEHLTDNDYEFLNDTREYIRRCEKGIDILKEYFKIFETLEFLRKIEEKSDSYVSLDISWHSNGCKSMDVYVDKGSKNRFAKCIKTPEDYENVKKQLEELVNGK